MHKTTTRMAYLDIVTTTAPAAAALATFVQELVGTWPPPPAKQVWDPSRINIAVNSVVGSPMAIDKRQLKKENIIAIYYIDIIIIYI